MLRLSRKKRNGSTDNDKDDKRHLAGPAGRESFTPKVWFYGDAKGPGTDQMLIDFCNRRN